MTRGRRGTLRPSPYWTLTFNLLPVSRRTAAQRPYDQGAAAAGAALLGLIGRQPPAWITSTGLKVTRENLRESYEAVWHAPAPP